jgi:glycosyltransferase involved in cell wall biosynthesis
VPDELPVATLEDATIEQAVRLGSPWWRAQDVGTVAARIERQRRCYVQARACCTASRWAADSIVRDYAMAAEKVHVVGFGRNCDPRPVPRDWSRPRYLFVGREWERKGGHYLLRAFARVRARFPAAELELAGGHPRVDLPGVRCHGWIDATDPAGRQRLEELFERATCFVMPSASEPFGMAHVEAGAAGIPSIGTTVGGAAEAIGPEGGILVPPGDVDRLADAMLRLSCADVAARMGAAACERATWFTWPRVAERVLGALGLQVDPMHREVTRPGAGARA